LARAADLAAVIPADLLGVHVNSYEQTWQEDLTTFGPPSIQFGGSNLYYPKTLAYTTGETGDQLICFHLWNELQQPDTGPTVLYDEPVLSAIREIVMTFGSACQATC
jgi:hypothetical protein